MIDRLGRGAGVLLHISSLPSSYGIGTMGREAYKFVDELAEAGQKYWQVLPVGQTSIGDSPYQSFSAFAGNPYFIDLDYLIEEGLITQKDVDSIFWGSNEEYVDFEKMYDNRYIILQKAYDNWKGIQSEPYITFIEKNSEWIDDYALFMACKGHFKNADWLMWDDDIKFRKSEAISRYNILLSKEISFWKFLQFKFFSQWNYLKDYANKKGIQIIGDIPIYVALDSADVWSNSHLFQLDENRKPKAIAGCPPDAFSEDGQRWGNPLYDWASMEEEDFLWWKKRISASAKIYNIIRIDHFIGVVRYYSIPVDKQTKDGKYEQGPGYKLTNAINSSIGDAKIIAEDLGVKYEPVDKLLRAEGYPGMKVMLFGFDGEPNNEHLPHRLRKNSVIYIGTHDNDTLKGFLDSQSEKTIERIMDYVSAKDKKEICKQMIKSVYLSVADVCIVQMQDILEKNNFARMNFPSTMGNNWKWRLQKGEFSKKKIEMLKKFADISGRM